MKKQQGFTLIELMIVVAVVAILVSIALPNYQDFVRKGRRSDAFDALLYIQNLEEKWRANNTTYGSLANIGYTGTSSQEGFYTLAVANRTARGYSITATAATGTTQVHDSGCTGIVLTVNAANPRGSKTPTTCW